jgi:hypothetical protein
MRRVHVDNVLRQCQSALAELVGCHERAQIAHGRAVLLGIGNGRERMHAAIVLGQGQDIGPRRVFGVVFRHLSFGGSGRGKDCVEKADGGQDRAGDDATDEVHGHGGVVDPSGLSGSMVFSSTPTQNNAIAEQY